MFPNWNLPVTGSNAKKRNMNLAWRFKVTWRDLGVSWTDIIDPAVLRPGRLDKTLYVGLPSPEDRTDILRTLTKVRLEQVGLVTAWVFCEILYLVEAPTVEAFERRMDRHWRGHSLLYDFRAKQKKSSFFTIMSWNYRPNRSQINQKRTCKLIWKL